MHAQPVCDSIDVGVVRRNGRDVEYVAVREADRSQVVDVGTGHVTRSERQLLNVFEHCDALIAEASGTPVALDRCEKAIIFEKTPQTAAVMGESVVASVDVAHDQGDEFALDLAQRLR